MNPIIVIGSLNMDLVVQTLKFPRAGETVAAASFQTTPGGKGANQAIAAARLSSGAQVFMVGQVGEDAFGMQLINNLTAEHINTAEIRRLPKVSTGVAVILVEPNGENRILIIPGANGMLSPEAIDTASDLIGQASLLVMQFEIPLETIERAIHLANARGVPVLFNPAPANSIPDELLGLVDYLVLNEIESEMLTGLPVSDEFSARAAGQRLLNGRTQLVVITLGSMGAVALTPDSAVYVPAYEVHAVDTTAAGDAFIGALAASLIQHKGLEESVMFASAAGALAVTRVGAQSSIPMLDEVMAFLEKRSVSIKTL